MKLVKSVLLSSSLAMANGAHAAFEVKALTEACAERVGQTRVSFKGQSFIASLQTYELNIRFEQGKKGFSYNTNWGSDIEGSLDFENLTEFWTSSYTTLPSSSQYNAAVTPDKALNSLNNLETYLKIAKKNLIAENPSEKAESQEAIDCALERSRFYAETVRQKYLIQRELSGPR